MNKYLPKIFFLIVLVCLVPGVTFCQAEQALSSPPQRSEDLCSLVDVAMRHASKLRGLSVKRKVPCRMQDQQEVEKYLRETVDKEVTPQRIENEGKIYKLLGVIPYDYDYLNGVIGLYTSQLGGYYDPKKEFYAMAAWMPAMMQMPIAVHELTHALQDQHYALEQFIDQKTQASDVLLAHSALVEGDATAVMADYSRATLGQGSIAKEDSVSGMLMQNISGALFSPSFAAAPKILQANLLFPYVSGLNFAHAILKVGGYQRLDDVFKNPPQSTREILHPEQYLQRVRGDKTNLWQALSIEELQSLLPPLPEEYAAQEVVTLMEDTLGEFFVSTMLSTWLPPERASRAAVGWKGDRLSLVKIGGERQILRWGMVWQDETEAKEFAEALREAYNRRFSLKPEEVAGRVEYRGRPEQGLPEMVVVIASGKKVGLLVW